MDLQERNALAPVRKGSAVGPGLFSFSCSLRAGLRLRPDELERLQLVRLQPLLEHAYRSVPYYRRLFDSVGFRPHHLRRPSDLQAIPVTTREQLQKIPKNEITTQRIASRLREAHTSGSTGVPLTVYQARREAWMRKLLTLRAFFQNGLKWSDRVVTISRHPSTTRGLWFKRFPLLQQWNLCFFEEPEKLLHALLELQPTVIYGFAANLAILADLMLKKGIDPLKPRFVATSSDLLTPGFRRVIAKAFHADPLDIYNCTELGDIACQCERRSGLHINADWLIVELLRGGKQVLASELGEIVVTNLFRYAMPMIRYSPGDLATLTEASCPCGLRLPTLTNLEGRTNSVVPLPDGRFFKGFSTIMGDFLEVDRYQIVQTALDCFLVRIVASRGACNELPERIARIVRERLGPQVRVECEAVDAIKPLPSGKYQSVIPLAPVDFGNAP